MSQSQYEELMQQTNITYRICGVCHRSYVSSELIEVEDIQRKRVHPWAICKECSKQISDAYQQSKKG